MTQTPSQAASAFAFARWPRFVRWAAMAAATLLLLYVLAWLLVPSLVKAQAEQRLSALLGREVTLGAVKFAPWSLELTLEQLRIGAAANAPNREPQFSVARLHVNADLRSVLRLAPVIEAIDIDSPSGRLTRLADGRYDIDDLLARLARNTPAAADDKPARFALYNLRLADGRFEFDDQPVQRKHRLQDLQLSVPFLSNLPDDVAVTVEPRLKFTLDGAAFDSGAQAKPFAQDRASQLDLRIADLNLAPWLPYLPAGLPLRPSRGILASQLQVQFAMPAGAAPRVSIKGQATLRDVSIVSGSGAGEPFAEWKQLQLGLTDVQPLAGTSACQACRSTARASRCDVMPMAASTCRRSNRKHRLPNRPPQRQVLRPPRAGATNGPWLSTRSHSTMRRSTGATLPCIPPPRCARARSRCRWRNCVGLSRQRRT